MNEADAAASIRRFLNLLKGLAELEPELASIASIKQAAQEAVNRTALARVEEDKAKAALGAALDQVSDAKREAKELTEGAKANHDKAVIHAGEEASQLIAAAKAAVAQIKQDALGELKSLEAKIAAAKASLKGLEDKIEAGQLKYEETQEKLDKLVAGLGRR